MFRALADHSQEFIGICDLALKPLYVNEAGMRLVGLSSLAEACAVKVHDFFFREDQPYIRDEFFPKVLREGAAEVEIRFRHFKTGAAVWVIYNVFQIRDSQGLVSGYATLSRDITDRRRSETEMRRTEEMLQAALDNAPAGIIVVDQRGEFLVANRALRQMLGGAPTGTAGGPAGGYTVHTLDGSAFPPERLPLVRALRGEESSGVELVIRRADGTEVVGLCGGAPARDNDGKVWGAVATMLDITERKRAEERLRKSESRWNAALESFDEGAIIATESEDVVYWNPAAQRMHGFKSPEEGIEPLADTPRTFELWTPDGSHLLTLDEWPMKRIKRGETVKNLELRLRRPDQGWERFVSYSGTMVETAGERFIFLSVHDLTEQRKAENLLRESEAKLRAVIEEAPLAMVLTGPAGEILFRNPRFDQLWGRPPHVTTAGTYSDVYEGYHLDGRLIESKEWPGARSVLKGEIIENEVYELVQASGQRITCWFGSAPIRSASGEILGAVVVFRDITKERRMEEALRESERRLTLAQQAGRVGVYDWDIATDQIVWTSQLEKLYGIDASGAGDKQAVWLEHVHPDDRQKLLNGTREWLESSSNERHWEYRFIRPDGQERWLSGHSLVIRDPAGRPVRVVGTNTDITEQKNFQAELERLVAERTASLHELVGELEHLSYTITHDMRAPLRAMRGFAEAMEELCVENPQPELHIFLRRLKQGAERMDMLITDALQYTKAVRQEIPLGPVDLGALLRGMLETYPGFVDAGIELQEPVLPVFGNEAALTQCFSNLIGNAVKFSKRGEKPKVRVWTERRPEAGSGGAGAGWVRVWVEDQGIGISERMRPRLFQMFSRGSREYEGTGIGLALVRKVVQRMGGRVGVESEEGIGSRFWVELRGAGGRFGAG